MRTLVGEGIGAFIVVGYEHPLVGLEVFSFRESSWSVIYGIISLWESLWIRWSVGSKQFRNTWVASKYLVHTVNLYHSLSASFVSSWTVSLLKASALWNRRPFGSTIMHLMARGKWMEAWLTRSSRQPAPLVSFHVVVNLFFVLPPHQLPPYSIIPSVMDWRFCGVVELLFWV